MKKGECIFCKIASKNIPSLIAYEDDNVIAFNDINPKAPVHIIIMPKDHIGRVSEFTKNDSELIANLIFAGNEIAKKKKIADTGYRFVINCNRDAGQEVFHLHMHILGGGKLGPL